MKEIFYFFLVFILIFSISGCDTVYYTNPQPTNCKTGISIIPQLWEGTYKYIHENGDFIFKSIVRTDKYLEIYFQNDQGIYDIIPHIKLNLDRNVIIISEKVSSYILLDSGTFTVDIRKTSENQICINILTNEKLNLWEVFVLNNSESDNYELITSGFHHDEYIRDMEYYNRSANNKIKYEKCRGDYCSEELIIDASSSEFYSILNGKLLRRFDLVKID